MKLLLAFLLLSLPAFAATDADFQAFFNAWKSKHKQDIADLLKPTDARCCKGGKYGNPERTDAAYRAWKDMRDRIDIDGMIDGDRFGDRKEVWATVSKEPWDTYIRRGLLEWSAKNVRRMNTEYPNDWPPPETWEAKGTVDTAGRATDTRGEISTRAYGPNWVKFFWVPLALGLVAALYIGSKGGPPTITFAGTVALYGWMTNPMEVFGCFLSVWIVFVMFIVMLLKVMLKGMGVGK